MSTEPRSIPVEVYAESTFSSETLKFTTNMVLLKEVGADFSSQKEAEGRSPLAQQLFDFEYVENVFIYHNFIAVTKKGGYEWYSIMPRLRHFIKSYLEKDTTVLAPEFKMKLLRQVKPQADDNDVIRKIKETLQEHVQTSIGVDGGDVKLSGYEDGTVFLSFEGAYCNCPSSKATVRSSLEHILKQKVSEVEQVQMDDAGLEEV